MKLPLKINWKVSAVFMSGLILGALAAALVGRAVYRYQAIETSLVLRTIENEKLFPTNFSSKLPVIWSGFTGDKVVALTFDDGPDPRFTPKILDILKTEKIKANFFVVGKNAVNWPELVEREQREGHLIGNHTWDHSPLLFASRGEINRELRLNELALKKLNVGMSKFFRPPYGATSDNVLSAAVTDGYQIVLWSNELHEKKFSPEDDARFVAASVKPGAIILAHDGGLDHSKGLATLPSLIKRLKYRGFKFVLLNRLPFNKRSKSLPFTSAASNQGD